jgi:hypothetical protein
VTWEEADLVEESGCVVWSPVRMLQLNPHVRAG